MFNEDDFDRETAFIESLNTEELALYLARSGISPEDTRRGLEKLLANIRDIERREMVDHYEQLERLSIEQELGLRR